MGIRTTVASPGYQPDEESGPESQPPWPAPSPRDSPQQARYQAPPEAAGANVRLHYRVVHSPAGCPQSAEEGQRTQLSQQEDQNSGQLRDPRSAEPLGPVQDPQLAHTTPSLGLASPSELLPRQGWWSVAASNQPATSAPTAERQPRPVLEPRHPFQGRYPVVCGFVLPSGTRQGTSTAFHRRAAVQRSSPGPDRRIALHGQYAPRVLRVR